MGDALDVLAVARKAGAGEERLLEAMELHRKGQWRLDFVSSKNSVRFHAPQEAACRLGEAIYFLRRVQTSALEAVSAQGRETAGRTPSK